MDIEPLLQRLAQELVDGNSEALGLTGSHARGDAGAYSDVDLWHFVHRLPADPFAGYQLRMVQGHLVSISLRRLAQEAALMRAPVTAVDVVPSFRQMRVLHDPQGALARVIAEARAFEWGRLRPAAAAQAGYELCGNAEEVGKLLRALALDDELLACFWLNALLSGLVRAVTLGLGLLVETENRQLQQLQAAVGVDSEWSRALRAALGLPPAPVAARARAGLRFYCATAALLAPTLQPAQAPVVAATLARIEAALN